MHDSFFDSFPSNDLKSMLNIFAEECIQHSKLHHPNIVQCLGVHQQDGSSLPMLVMEYMPLSLTKCLEKYSNIPSSVKYRILLGVSSGLAYLHDHQPPIVHRDLTANNVLLTEAMQAKIADFGVSRVIAADKRMSTLTKVPGTPIYMPPEALLPSPTYDTKLDIFSFGILIIHVVLQVLPIPTCGPTKVDEKDPNKLFAVSETERRSNYIEKMKDGSVLQSLAKSCLNNAPEQRPHIETIISELEKLESESENAYSFSNTLEAEQLLKERQEAEDILLLRAQNLHSQLVAVFEEVKDDDSSVHTSVSSQISATAVAAGEMARCNSYSEEGSRFIVTYRHPSAVHQKVFLQMSLKPNTGFSVVVQPPVNMPFHGTYVKTIASGLKNVWGVAVGKNGRVFVVDNKGFGSVYSYDSERRSSVLVQSQSRIPGISPPEPSCWYPTEIAVLGEDILIVADTGNNRLLKLRLPEHPSGEVSLVAQTKSGLFTGKSPAGIGILKDHSIFVCDRENHQVVVLNSNLVLKKKFGSHGNGPDQFHHPWAVDFDSKSNVYVSDCSNSCIKVFTPDLKPLRTISGPGNKPENLRGPTGICIDANDFLYVADKAHHRVFVFDPAGNFKMVFGEYGYENGQLIDPLGIAVDEDRFVYVSDGEGYRVQVFA